MAQERWTLGPASALVVRISGRAHITLAGVVTAQAFEALHLWMAREPLRERAMLIDERVTLAATNRSLAEAAARGTPSRDAGPVLLLVPPTRFRWALRHAELMAELGVSRPVKLAAQPAPLALQVAPGTDRRVH